MQWSLYLVGSFGYAVLYSALLSMHIYRYDPGEPNSYGLPVLVSSAIVGIAALIGRLFNPISSLTVGNLSDQTRSRWGRRRPFMALALLPMLAGFVLVFTPPIPYANHWNAIYLTATLILFFASFSAYMTPYLALIAEIARTQQERVKLTTLIAMFNLLGNAVGLIAAPWLVQQFGFLNMALILVTIGFVALGLPLGIQEDPNLPIPKQIPIWKSLQIAAKNSAFRPFVANQIQMWITINIIYLSTNYLVIALLQQQLGFGTVVNGATLTGAIFGFIPANLLTKRCGKKVTLRFYLVALGFNLLALGIWPLWFREALWLCLMLLILFGATLSALFILPNAILADIIDEDTKQTGAQRGAIYFGIQAMVITVSSGVASLIVGAILMLGKTSIQPLGVQFVYAVAGLFAFGASWTLNYYPIQK
ncbi:MAG: MFS transporter [Scytonema sp. PMC 1069.18]|nr:MFS transporter [Scytonema sp. PMC 1069.18]MEC4882114.1 MFS transporter [Scytonema sp. PMC 1070.18]